MRHHGPLLDRSSMFALKYCWQGSRKPKPNPTSLKTLPLYGNFKRLETRYSNAGTLGCVTQWPKPHPSQQPRSPLFPLALVLRRSLDVALAT
eukprot:scaffold289927_cov32-Tisochrysis_lutea.AAC.1